MKILFTGGSSFTGYWLIRNLVERGHRVVATFRQPQTAYVGVREERVSRLTTLCETHFVCPTPSAHFNVVIEQSGPWDLWCAHAAKVTDYKSADFDPLQALQNNCADLPTTLERLQNQGCQRVLLTGSVFEQGEGSIPTENAPACSPYGLSKGLTSDVFAFYAQRVGMHLGKFIIPNPFGPFEEGRLTTSLVTAWKRGETPAITSPDYVRDNIHVTLLAKAYGQFAETLPSSSGQSTMRPSGYVETQRDFVARFANEIGARLQIVTPVTYAQQTDFTEPLSRTNRDSLDAHSLGWNENDAWNELAQYYESHDLS